MTAGGHAEYAGVPGGGFELGGGLLPRVMFTIEVRVRLVLVGSSSATTGSMKKVVKQRQL